MTVKGLGCCGCGATCKSELFSDLNIYRGAFNRWEWSDISPNAPFPNVNAWWRKTTPRPVYRTPLNGPNYPLSNSPDMLFWDDSVYIYQPMTERQIPYLNGDKFYPPYYEVYPAGLPNRLGNESYCVGCRLHMIRVSGSANPSGPHCSRNTPTLSNYQYNASKYIDCLGAKTWYTGPIDQIQNNLNWDDHPMAVNPVLGNTVLTTRNTHHYIISGLNPADTNQKILDQVDWNGTGKIDTWIPNGAMAYRFNVSCNGYGFSLDGLQKTVPAVLVIPPSDDLKVNQHPFNPQVPAQYKRYWHARIQLAISETEYGEPYGTLPDDARLFNGLPSPPTTLGWNIPLSGPRRHSCWMTIRKYEEPVKVHNFGPNGPPATSLRTTGPNPGQPNNFVNLPIYNPTPIREYANVEVYFFHRWQAGGNFGFNAFYGYANAMVTSSYFDLQLPIHHWVTPTTFQIIATANINGDFADILGPSM